MFFLTWTPPYRLNVVPHSDLDPDPYRLISIVFIIIIIITSVNYHL